MLICTMVGASNIGLILCFQKELAEKKIDDIDDPKAYR